jgi:hypothetical protein
MQPFVIRQGDYLAKLACRFGFDADTVWKHPANAKLRDARPNPNILSPGDVLQIPEPAPLPQYALVLGATNIFTCSTPPTTSITLRFLDPNLASQAFTVQELADLTGLSTGADGSVTLDVPVTAGRVTLEFTSSGATHECRIGHVDPIDTISGVFCRLQNLGYLSVDATLGATDIESLREALRAFNTDRAGGPSSVAPSSEAPPSSSPPSSAPSPEAGVSADAGTSLPYGCPAPEGSVDSGGGGDDAPPSSPDAPPHDNAGLADDGTLDASTAQALAQAHRS